MALFDAVNVAPFEILKSPETARIGSFVSAVTVTGFVPSPIVKVSAVVNTPPRSVYTGEPAALGARSSLLYDAEVMLVALVEAYLKSEVSAANVPLTTNGVPAPESFHVEDCAFKTWFIATARTFVASTMFAPIFVVVATVTASPSVRL